MLWCGCDCVIVDDMIDTGSRMALAGAALKKAGASRIFAFATHGLFTGQAMQRLEQSDLEEVIVFNTVPLRRGVHSYKIQQLTAGKLIAECIRRIHSKESVSALF